jgi:hypothetical protein
MCSPCVAFPATQAVKMLRADSSHEKSCTNATEWFPYLMIRWIWRLLLLAMHCNDDSILIQSLEHPRDLPVRPSAEQAVKVPLQPLQGSGDSAKHDVNSVSSIFPVFPSFHSILPDFLHSNSVLAPRRQQAAVPQHSAHLCTNVQRQQTVNSKVWKF